ncbi:MAG TPA: hypothetical protein VJN18_34605 [Polyangiaceae bacterium]|nr:hypothetical protein [Polyangiaceae bacterium]
MTNERDKSSRAGASVARPTARDVPFVRGDESVSEPAPQGQRPGQLSRDPTYEQELGRVDLAVLRDRTDPSTKQGGHRGHALPQGQPPGSVTPESPGARLLPAMGLSQSPEPPTSSGRAVASGTLLSVGAVDPRGKTERTLETPRLFFSQADAAEQAYFRPGAIPAVTVHQTLETETVKLSDSIDPRRAKTIPRMDRLGPLPLWDEPESAAPWVLSGPESSVDSTSSDAGGGWTSRDFAEDPRSLPEDHDGQIHASLSPFREHAAPSYELHGVSTKPEPIASRRASDAPPPLPSAPDQSTVPTQRDLPAHRIEVSQPQPARDSSAPLSVAGPDSQVRGSDLPRPTTASIAVEELERRAVWVNYVAFLAALVFAVVVGVLLTRKPEAQVPETARPPLPAPVELEQPAALEPAAPAVAPPAAEVAKPEAAVAAPAPKSPVRAAPAAPKKSSATPVAPAPAPAPPSKSAPSKTSRETIF